MGTTYKFKCSKCGYIAEVSGGKDWGFVAKIETMLCKDCKELVDVLIGIEGETSKKSKANKDIGKCPICHDTNLKRWDTEKRPCPKCGKKMKQGKLLVLWD